MADEMSENLLPYEQINSSNEETENHRHENAAKEKAESFVGRTRLRGTVMQFCTSPNVESNTMIVTGWPGDGKTSLLAYVSAECMENLRKQGDFVFTHIVDCCPGSNILQNMLKRLHRNLGMYTMGDNPLKTTTDLKTMHMSRLEEAAKNYPSKKFIIFVDAVNQFSKSMKSHSMWWLPSRRAPKNLRVIISTLSCTGDTLENARKRCPKAVIVEMPREMLEADCKEMVLAMLKRHDIEITTENNDPIAGNQMEKLLNKRKKPLYLKTAVEGLRTKWIMATNCPQSEAYTIYIENLPLTTEELFEKLLDSWEGDFGVQLIRWLMTIISLSRDGLKESMLADLMAHVDENQRINFKYSVKTVLDFIRGFLSAESMDYIRFFHGELSQVALYRYKSRNFVPEVHNMIIQFFMKHIKAKISDKFDMQSLYYEDCLSQVVYHQTEIRKYAQDWNLLLPQVSTYNDTLKNIFYINERISFNQEMELLNDFRDTADVNMEEDERKSISDWERFTQFHWPYVKEFPQWSYAFAVNQPNDNAVAMDTRALSTLSSEVDDTFPLKWLNKPDNVDKVGKTLWCVGKKCWSCCVSTADQNRLAFGCNFKAFICNQTTGDIVHQVKVGGSAHTVHVSPTGATLWVGDNWGMITVWDTHTGELEHEELKVGGGWVIMMVHVNDETVLCGTGGNKTYSNDETVGTIAVVDTTTHTVKKTWSTQLPCWSYCYHAGEELVVSGHNKKIICWNVKHGFKMNVFKVSNNKKFKLPVSDMCAHNELPIIVFVMNTQFAGEIKTLNLTTGECNIIVRECGRFIAQFDHTGDNIICTSVNHKTIQVYDLSGLLLNTIRIHGGEILNISSLPHPCSFVSAGPDGGKSHIDSTTPVVESTTQVVTWCQLLPNNKEFVTLSEEGEVDVCDVSSLQPRGSAVVKFGIAGWRAAVHPSGEYMLVCTLQEIFVVNLGNVEIMHRWEPTEGIPTFIKCVEGISITIRCVQFSPSGDKCVILTSRHGTHVYKVHSMYMFEHLLTYTVMKNEMYWCDVTERQCVSGGDSGIVLWDIDTGETLKVLRTEHYCRYVKFLNLPQRRVLYHIWEAERGGQKDEICIMNMDGLDVKTFDTKVDPIYPKPYIFDKHMITAESDGSIRLHDMSTEEILYVFVDEQSLGLNAFLDNPVTKTITCYNGNGRSYTFEKTFA